MKMKMLNLPEQGYTPANYAKLVELTQLSNVAFCELFSIPKGTFEKHKAGTRTMKWQDWQALLETVKQHLTTEQNTMSNFINNLKFNHAIINKVGRNPKSPKAAEAVQQNLKSVVIAVYDNDLFKIAGLDGNTKKLVEFTASKGDEALDFWFGQGWQSKVIKIERINDPDELIKIEDIA